MSVGLALGRIDGCRQPVLRHEILEHLLMRRARIDRHARLNVPKAFRSPKLHTPNVRLVLNHRTPGLQHVAAAVYQLVGNGHA